MPEVKHRAWRWLIRGVVAIMILLVVSPLICICPCTEIETRRWADFDDSGATMWFVVSGFRACPLTPEGPFPEWGASIKVSFSEGLPRSQVSKQRYELGKDFSIKYDVARSGTIEIDRAAMKAHVALTYSQSYYWLGVVKGEFPIRPEVFRPSVP
jgi:hypothetical protein